MTGLSARRARDVLSVAILMAGWGAGLPAGASAASVVAAPAAPDIVSEVPFPVTITGIAETPSTLSVGLAAIGEGCYSPVIAKEILADLPVSGPFALEQPGLVGEPGQHLLCAFLETTDGYRTVAASIAPFAARAPRSSFIVSAPPVVALGRPVRIRVTGGSEAPRSVFGKLAAPGTDCAEALSSGLIFLGLRSEVTAIDQVEQARLDRYGTWRACVRTERYWTGDDPTDGVFEAPIRVTVRCTAASRELSRARDRWRAMSRRLRLRGLPPSPHLSIRGMAVRRARAWVAEACSPGA